jgi:hypothetical protein
MRLAVAIGVSSKPATVTGSDITKHPLYDNIKTMSLNSVGPISGGSMSDDLLKKIDADLAAA